LLTQIQVLQFSSHCALSG